MCMLLTGMMAASMIAGCGNSGNASANAGADTNTEKDAFYRKCKGLNNSP